MTATMTHRLWSKARAHFRSLLINLDAACRAVRESVTIFPSRTLRPVAKPARRMTLVPMSAPAFFSGQLRADR